METPGSFLQRSRQHAKTLPHSLFPYPANFKEWRKREKVWQRARVLQNCSVSAYAISRSLRWLRRAQWDGAAHCNQCSSGGEVTHTSYFPIDKLSLYLPVAHVNNAMSDHGLNTLPAWSNYTGPLTVVSQPPPLLTHTHFSFWFSKIGSTNNHANAVRFLRDRTRNA